MNDVVLRDLGIACSLANLCYFSVWGQLLPGAPLHYFLEQPPPRAALLTAMAGVVVLTLLFWAGATAVRRSRGRLPLLLGRLAFLAATITAANGIRRQTPALAFASLQQSLGRAGLVALAVVVALAAVACFARWRWGALRGLALLVLAFLPFAALTLGRAAWAVVRYEQTYADFANGPYAAAQHPAGAPRPRVVWLIFDEMDYSLSFERRPSGVALPEFDRFRAESVYATQAYPPAGETFLSIPALVTGRQISRAEPVGPRQLNTVLAVSREREKLNGATNVFSQWHEAGGNAAAVGFYHPYCRLFADSLIDCAWSTDYAGQARKNVPGLSPMEIAVIQLGDVVDGLPLATQLGLRRMLINLTSAATAKRRGLSVQRYERTLAEAKRVLAESEADLVYLHFPVPHGPNIYDRAKGSLVAEGARSYADNLQLADRTLGELRHLLEDNGTWDATAVMITADHEYRFNLWKPWKKPGEDAALGREGDFRVPMMLKLPGQREARAYDKPFTTTAIAPLLLTLGGEVRTPDDAVHWLDEHAAYAPLVCGRNSACGGRRPELPVAAP